MKISGIDNADIKKAPSFDDEVVEAYQSGLSDSEVDFDAGADEDESATKHKKRALAVGVSNFQNSESLEWLQMQEAILIKHSARF